MERENKEYAENPKLWKIFKEIRFDLVKNFALTLQKKFKQANFTWKKNYVPQRSTTLLHLIVKYPLENQYESLELFKIIFEHDKVKNPRDLIGCTPLHMSTKSGQYKIFEGNDT